MKTVHDIVNKTYVEAHATPSNVRLGKELADSHKVEVVANDPEIIEARVLGDTKRIVLFTATPQGVAWRCTCTKDKNLFCKHMVAVATVLK
jgi:uncharacterized Zn finger protein